MRVRGIAAHYPQLATPPAPDSGAANFKQPAKEYQDAD